MAITQQTKGVMMMQIQITINLESGEEWKLKPITDCINSLQTQPVDFNKIQPNKPVNQPVNQPVSNTVKKLVEAAEKAKVPEVETAKQDEGITRHDVLLAGRKFLQSHGADELSGILSEMNLEKLADVKPEHFEKLMGKFGELS